MKAFYSIVLLIFFSNTSFAQITLKNFGYRHFKVLFEKDTVDVLVKSYKGEEHIKKPIIFEVQGSTAVPLIVHDGVKQTRSVSILEGMVEKDYHLIIVNKPGLPLVCHQDSLYKGKYKNPKTKKYPKKYLLNNNLNYYVKRNSAIMSFLKTKTWVDTSKIVVAGHSEGSTIVAHMTDKIDGITHLIYSGGTPYYPRILTMIQQDRRTELKKNSNWSIESFNYWKDIIKYPLAFDRNEGWNTNYGTYTFSQSENDVLKRSNIPVLVSYGTLDEGAPFNDMFHIEVLKERLTNFTFNAYIGLDHHYIEARQDTSNFVTDKLNKVVSDWLKWLKDN